MINECFIDCGDRKIMHQQEYMHLPLKAVIRVAQTVGQEVAAQAQEDHIVLAVGRSDDQRAGCQVAQDSWANLPATELEANIETPK